MSEQQYRVVADRDKGDDPTKSMAEPGDLLIFRRGDGTDLSPLVRIERPVPSTDSQKLAESEDRAPGFSTSPHPPTREQVESAVGAVLFNASNYPRPAMPHILGQDIAPLRAKVTDAVLALFQNGAE